MIHTHTHMNNWWSSFWSVLVNRHLNFSSDSFSFVWTMMMTVWWWLMMRKKIAKYTPHTSENSVSWWFYNLKNRQHTHTHTREREKIQSRANILNIYFKENGCKSNKKSFHDADDGYSSFQRTSKKKSELDVAESRDQETDCKMHSMSNFTSTTCWTWTISMSLWSAHEKSVHDRKSALSSM